MNVSIACYPGLVTVECESIFKTLGCDVSLLPASTEKIPETDLVVIPGGASYGDHLRPGALAASAKISGAIRGYAKSGGKVLGIGNGFQILCELGLLPGALLKNSGEKFEGKEVIVRKETKDSFLTSNLPDDELYKLPLGCFSGRYWADKRTMKDLSEQDLILFCYCDEEGDSDLDEAPTGSLLDIAGILSRNRNIAGIMPHPDRAIDPLIGSTDGKVILENLTKAL